MENTLTTFTNNTCTMDISWEAMLEAVRSFRERQKQIDNNMAAALRRLLPEQEGEERTYKIIGLAMEMNVSPFDIQDYLYRDKRPLSGSFYDAIRAWAEKKTNAQHSRN